MKIAGINKISFVDYPGNIATILFAPGCNFSCWYCHNKGILGKDVELLDFEYVLDYLKTRVGKIDGVVFSGGEPTLYKGLPDKMKIVKDMGFKVKLDTNGTNPRMVETLINENLVDYIAMDIKAPLDKYKMATCVDFDQDILKESIKLIMDKSLDYEFRTTFIPQLKLEDVESMTKSIQGAKMYALQQYVYRPSIGKMQSMKVAPHKADVFRKAREIALKNVQKCIVRGVDL